MSTTEQPLILTEASNHGTSTPVSISPAPCSANPSPISRTGSFMLPLRTVAGEMMASPQSTEPAEDYIVESGQEHSFPASPLNVVFTPPHELPSRRREAGLVGLSFTVPTPPRDPGSQPGRAEPSRSRAPSPPHARFQGHVAFDSIVGESTKVNLPAVTLCVKHKGYHPRRRSRTFMAGVDENAYSDYALKWLLDELIDDGDEVVCLRVVEREPRPSERPRDDARALMRMILAKNGANRAISVVLEYVFGKVTSTFQKMIIMYQPSMLIVGTKGRSLGGFQGLVSTRTSFSKYCLQYSPVPVVVVRPADKRLKKKQRRDKDPSRKSYSQMLASTNGKHEADEPLNTYEFEVKISPDEEAHQVARALGLTAAFDPYGQEKLSNQLSSLQSPDSSSRLPTPDPLSRLHTYDPPSGNHRPSSSHRPSSGVGRLSPLRNERAASTGPVAVPAPALEAVAEAGAEPDEAGADDEDADEDDDVDPDFDVVLGKDALDLDQKERLHEMEVSEATALRLHGADVASDDDE